MLPAAALLGGGRAMPPAPAAPPSQPPKLLLASVASLLLFVLLISLTSAGMQLPGNCEPPEFGGCGDEWPRACWQGGAVAYRWSFAVLAMVALFAQHRKLWRRQSSKGVSLPMVCLGCGSMVCEMIAQMIARLRVRPRWRSWDWTEPELTPLVVQALLAALWLALCMHTMYWAPSRSDADSVARQAGVALFRNFSLALGGLLSLVLSLLWLLGPCGVTVDLGCLLAACADALILLAWIPQLQLSVTTGSVGAMTIPGALIGGLGQIGAAATLSDCAVRVRCLLCIYMPAIDRYLSGCRWRGAPGWRRCSPGWSRWVFIHK